MNAFIVSLKILVRTCWFNTIIFGTYMLFTQGIGEAVIFFFTMVFVLLVSLFLSPILTIIFSITNRLPYTNSSCIAWFAFIWNLLVIMFVAGICKFLGPGFPDAGFIILVSLGCWVAIYRTKKPVLSFIKNKGHENNLA